MNITVRTDVQKDERTTTVYVFYNIKDTIWNIKIILLNSLDFFPLSAP